MTPFDLLLLPEEQFNRLLALTEMALAPRLNQPVEYDFIQHYYGKPDMTHRWNEFRSKPSVVETIMATAGY